MPGPDARTERRLSAFARGGEEALGRQLVCLVLPGSAAGGGWGAGRSDLNTPIVVPPLTPEVLGTPVPLGGRVLRHLLGLRGGDAPFAYADVLAAGEALLGTLPTMRRLLERRAGLGRLDRRALHGAFAAYLGEIERIVAAVDALVPDA